MTPRTKKIVAKKIPVRRPSLNRVAEEEHTEDLADEIGVAETRLDGRGEGIGIELFEQRVHVSDNLSIEAVGEEGEPRDQHHENRADPGDAILNALGNGGGALLLAIACSDDFAVVEDFLLVSHGRGSCVVRDLNRSSK